MHGEDNLQAISIFMQLSQKEPYKLQKKKSKHCKSCYKTKIYILKIYFKCLELPQIPAFVANSGASLKDNVKKKKMKFVHYKVIWQNDLG